MLKKNLPLNTRFLPSLLIHSRPIFFHIKHSWHIHSLKSQQETSRLISLPIVFPKVGRLYCLSMFNSREGGHEAYMSRITLRQVEWRGRKKRLTHPFYNHLLHTTTQPPTHTHKHLPFLNNTWATYRLPWSEWCKDSMVRKEGTLRLFQWHTTYTVMGEGNRDNRHISISIKSVRLPGMTSPNVWGRKRGADSYNNALQSLCREAGRKTVNRGRGGLL